MLNPSPPWHRRLLAMEYGHASSLSPLAGSPLYAPCDDSSMTPGRIPNDVYSRVRWGFTLSPNGSPLCSPCGAHGLYLPISPQWRDSCSRDHSTASPSPDGSPDSTGSLFARHGIWDDIRPKHGHNLRFRNGIPMPARPPQLNEAYLSHLRWMSSPERRRELQFVNRSSSNSRRSSSVDTAAYSMDSRDNLSLSPGDAGYQSS